MQNFSNYIDSCSES